MSNPPGKRALGVLALTIAGVCLAGTVRAGAQTVDPAYRAEVMKLLEVTGAAKLGAQSAAAVADPLISALGGPGQLPAPAIAIIRDTLNQTFERAFSDTGGLMSEIVAVYAKHLTIEEVRGLTAFYQTDLGKKVTGVMPLVLQESSAAGQRWVATQMPAILDALEDRLKKEGYLKPGGR